FHFMHDIVKSYSLALARRVRQAHQALQTAEQVLSRHTRPEGQPQDAPEAQQHVEVRRAAVQHWEEVHRTYRRHLEALSLTLHPFRLSDSAPQTSAQVASRLQAEVEAIEALAEHQQLPEHHNAMQKVRKQVPALAALVDFWWQGVWRDVEPFGLSPLWRQWVQEILLPLVYWEHQAAQTRCARRKAKLVQALEAVRPAFEMHTITQHLAPPVLVAWQAWAADRVKTFQRASSAVEGRNGYLAQMHHNHRGLPKQRYKVWAALHNFDGRASDGTTPAVRFFGRAFPDLFETVL